MPALMNRAIHNTRRQPALSRAVVRELEQWSSWQQPDIGHLDLGAEAPNMQPVAATGSSMAQTLTIGTLATATATKVETIRYYERIGLMPEPARSAGNYRTYDGAHVARLRFVRRARDLGFTIEQIRALLDLADQ